MAAAAPDAALPLFLRVGASPDAASFSSRWLFAAIAPYRTFSGFFLFTITIIIANAVLPFVHTAGGEGKCNKEECEYFHQCYFFVYFSVVFAYSAAQIFPNSMDENDATGND